MMRKKSQAGFTMMEILIVVIMITIITGFAIPNYQASIQKSQYQKALGNLRSIHGAAYIYKAKNGTFWPAATAQPLSAINTNLNLNIIDTDITYAYDTSGGSGFSVTATEGTWTLTMDDATLSSTNPSCTGTCP